MGRITISDGPVKDRVISQQPRVYCSYYNAEAREFETLSGFECDNVDRLFEKLNKYGYTDYSNPRVPLKLIGNHHFSGGKFPTKRVGNWDNDRALWSIEKLERKKNKQPTNTERLSIKKFDVWAIQDATLIINGDRKEGTLYLVSLCSSPGQSVKNWQVVLQSQLFEYFLRLVKNYHLTTHDLLQLSPPIPQLKYRETVRVFIIDFLKFFHPSKQERNNFLMNVLNELNNEKVDGYSHGVPVVETIEYLPDYDEIRKVLVGLLNSELLENPYHLKNRIRPGVKIDFNFLDENCNWTGRDRKHLLDLLLVINFCLNCIQSEEDDIDVVKEFESILLAHGCHYSKRQIQRVIEGAPKQISERRERIKKKWRQRGIILKVIDTSNGKILSQN
jgi:hypothetical protein